MHIMRVATVYEPEVSALPKEFRQVLTKQDVEAIRGGSEFFRRLAENAPAKWLRRVLIECAGSISELQFHSSGDEPYRPFYRFYWGGGPAISLPRKRRLRADMPEFLRKIYGTIGSFRESDFDMAGGLYPGEQLGPLSESGVWVKPGGPIQPEDAIPFLGTFAGSELCYLREGGGAWLNDDGDLRRVRSLEREVTRYFEVLLKGDGSETLAV